jgi:hypothetical protein
MVKIYGIVTVDDFMEIVSEVLKSNPTYAGHTVWHPEDLNYAVQSASEDVANTIVALHKRGLLVKKNEEQDEKHNSSE